MNLHHEDYQHKLYFRRKSPTWWLRNIKYFMFMMRELSSAFIGAFLLLFLYELFLISKGEAVFNQFQTSLRSPAFIVFYVIALIFALYHTVTWFGVVGRIQQVKVGKTKVPPSLVTASAFAGWIVVSIAIGLFFFGVI